jgi:chromosome segregation ATPase
LQAENKRLEQTLAAAEAARKDAEKRLVEMNEQAVKAKLDGLTADVKTRDEKITSLTTQVQTEQKARTDAEAKVAALEKEKADLQTEITKTQAAAQKTGRVATIVTELSMDNAAATKFYDEEVADLKMSDERFTKFIATLKANKTPTTAAKTSETATETPASAQAALNNAAPNGTGKAAPLGTEGVNSNVQATQAKLSSFLATNCLRKKPAATQE